MGLLTGRAWPTLCLAVSIGLAGCGRPHENDFEQKMRELGGGLTRALVLEAIDAVASDQGTTAQSVHIDSMTLTFGRVRLDVVSPDGADDLQHYDYSASYDLGHKGLQGPEPIEQTATPASFTLTDADIDHFDDTVDRALASADVRDGWASQIVIERPGRDNSPQISVTVTNGAETVDVTLTPGARTVDVDP
jgi:hypothetical protein